MESIYATGISRTVFSKTTSNIVAFAKKRPWHASWGVVILLIVFIGLAAPVLSPFDPLLPDVKNMRSAPDAEHWGGTDFIGRDLMSRLFYGTRASLFIALCSVLIGTIVGGTWGLASGYLGGKLDLISERFVEILLALPGLILAYMLVLVFGASFWTVIAALGISRVPTVSRVVRSIGLSVKQSMYIEAARSIGASQARIMWKHVLPQCVAGLIVLITVNIGGIIIAEASLSYLGVGISAPTPSWGRMLSEASTSLYPSWWLVTLPGVAITLTVLSFNLFGDGLRDALDPRLRGTE